MYTSFHIKNFRGFADLELNDLARINLIAGKNNVGKTSFLEALFLHARAYNSYETLNLNISRGLEFEQAADISLLFNQRNTAKDILLQGNDMVTGQRSLRLRPVDEADELSLIKVTLSAERYTNGSSTPVQVMALEYEQEKNNQNGTSYLIRSSQKEVNTSGALPLPFASQFIQAHGRPPTRMLAEQVSTMEISGQEQLLQNALTILEPRLRRLSVLYLEDKPVVWAETESIRLPLNLMGEGFYRLANIITSITQTANGILLIDEIENGLHHSVLTDVWEAIAIAAREFNVQIFATTHSLEMIRAAHEAFEDDDPYDFRLHRLDRHPETGDITAVTYDKEIMEAAVDLNAEVR